MLHACAKCLRLLSESVEKGQTNVNTKLQCVMKQLFVNCSRFLILLVGTLASERTAARQTLAHSLYRLTQQQPA